jgi:methyl-accepting chemotaxis protein
MSLNDAKNGLMEIISDLSAISEENAASTEETNASMEELNATFSIISKDAADLRALAEELNKTISFFKLG